MLITVKWTPAHNNLHVVLMKKAALMRQKFRSTVNLTKYNESLGKFDLMEKNDNIFQLENSKRLAVTSSIEPELMRLCDTFYIA